MRTSEEMLKLFEEYFSSGKPGMQQKSIAMEDVNPQASGFNVGLAKVLIDIYRKENSLKLKISLLVCPLKLF
ncbi:MAG: hypothetical protein M3512_18830 [Bacteroidota bacterium]|nr:hypothetical protein [Bacteroidota bacterium]